MQSRRRCYRNSTSSTHEIFEQLQCVRVIRDGDRGHYREYDFFLMEQCREIEDGGGVDDVVNCLSIHILSSIPRDGQSLHVLSLFAPQDNKT